ncbi:hypothetical protein [Roseateles sp. L2-2]|uniref:hypothetical protein n=1 Tax=Roseateles TaxID=93681 RepID=UPI003D36AC06
MGPWLPPIERIPLSIWLIVVMVAFGFLGFVAERWSLEQFSYFGIGGLALGLLIFRAAARKQKANE